MVDFKRPGEASGDHLRPPLGDFGGPWGHFGRWGESLWGTLGVLGITLGALRVALGSLGAHFGLFGGPPWDISPYGAHFVYDLESRWENSSNIS